jgi:hypothetical protein
MWTHQNMNVIRHYGEGVQCVTPLHIGGMMQDFHDHVGNRGLAEMQRTGTNFVQKAIQRGECSSGTYFGIMEHTIRREAAIQTPSYEDWRIDLIEVRKPTAIERHARIVESKRLNSQATGGSPAEQELRPTSIVSAIPPALALLVENSG